MNTPIIKPVPDGLISELDRRFAERVERILNSKSDWRAYGNAKIYYVSNDGDDTNDGLSVSTPLATLHEVMRRQNDGRIKHGDVVLLRRGDEWHVKFFTAQGVTYSAYGEGRKPRILGSVEADLPSQWIKTDAENVYAFRDPISHLADVGNIVFNDGECYGTRVLPYEGVTLSAGVDSLVSNGLNRWRFPPQPFSGYTDLAKIGREIPISDLMFYHDWASQTLYLYSREGNPGERFGSVELCTHDNAVRACSDVTIDNICVRYTGSHGIGAGTCRNLTVRNCEVGWIGGSVQRVAKLLEEPEQIKTRFGNAVEIYGAADGYYVHDCFMHQCFDCGPTVQVGTTLTPGKKIYQRNIAFYGNALREASLEIWMTSKPENTEDTFAKLINCRMYDNFVTKSGYGWKGYNHQKIEYCSFFGAGESLAEYSGCYMEDNCFWNLRRNLLKSTPTTVKPGRGFIWRNNTVIKNQNSELGYLAKDFDSLTGYVHYDYTEQTMRELSENGTFADNDFYYIPEELNYDATDKIPNPFG